MRAKGSEGPDFYSQLLLSTLVGFGHSGREIHGHESNCDVHGEGPVLKLSLTDHEVVSDPLKGNISHTCTYHTSAVSESQSENSVTSTNINCDITI